HCPVHALLQHTPSTQNPEVHWFAAPHVAPRPSFGWHTPPPQKCPAVQSPSTVHPPAHAVPAVLHVSGAQSTVITVGHDPAPVQLAESVATPLLHDAARQPVV